MLVPRAAMTAAAKYPDLIYKVAPLHTADFYTRRKVTKDRMINIFKCL